MSVAIPADEQLSTPEGGITGLGAFSASEAWQRVSGSLAVFLRGKNLAISEASSIVFVRTITLATSHREYCN
jgi:hypothetical protein